MSLHRVCVLAVAVGLCAVVASASNLGVFNGVADNETGQYGYYYEVTGGLFPTGTTPNGNAATGGTISFITDTLDMGYPFIDTWVKDSWFSDVSSIALTMMDGSNIVYDNNGIETGTYGDYYNEGGSHGTDGLYVGYSMANNYDWIYAGYFLIQTPTTVTSLTGFFAPFTPSAYDFQFNSPEIAYNMNIWSNVPNELLPTNTGSFTGNVFSSNTSPGVFSISDTGVARTYTDGTPPDDIYSLTYTLSTPMTLQPGIYWFSSDADIVPEPGSFPLLGAGLAALCLIVRRARGRLRPTLPTSYGS